MKKDRKIKVASEKTRARKELRRKTTTGGKKKRTSCPCLCYTILYYKGRECEKQKKVARRVRARRNQIRMKNKIWTGRGWGEKRGPGGSYIGNRWRLRPKAKSEKGCTGGALDAWLYPKWVFILSEWIRERAFSSHGKEALFASSPSPIATAADISICKSTKKPVVMLSCCFCCCCNSPFLKELRLHCSILIPHSWQAISTKPPLHARH
ncbi:hypothetical protein BX070DRAFT_44262 [Coemansia spiralis]|nr:hypothetical protein BX070DRAFT_44262 [Coemansia spiralis]